MSPLWTRMATTLAPKHHASAASPTPYFYRSDGASGSYADASTSVAARAVFSGTGAPVCTLGAWVRLSGASGQRTIFDVSDDGGPSLRITTNDGDVSEGYLDDDAASSDRQPEFNAPVADTWGLIAWTLDGTSGNVYLDGVDQGGIGTIVGTYATAADALTLFGDYAHANRLDGDLRAPFAFSRTLTAPELLAIATAGPGHDLTTATGAYSNANPVILWDRADVAGSVANRGSGGTCALTFHGGVTSVAL